MILGKFTKQPADIKDYDVDYTEWLAPLADTIVSGTASIACITDPTNTSFTCSQVTVAVTKVKVWVQGGTDGNKYKLTLTVNTEGGRRDECELIFNIKET